MKTYIQQFLESYRLAVVFTFAALPLFLLPVVFEGLQHVVEIHLGMFGEDGLSGMTTSDHRIRIAFGALKVLSLLAMLIFVPRYFLHGRSVGGAVGLSSAAKKGVLSAAALMLVALAWVFFVGPSILSRLAPSLSEVQMTLISMLALVALGFPLQGRMNDWLARVYDDAPISETQNKALTKAMKGGLAPALVLSVIPLFALHYALNGAAIGQASYMIWFLLAVDSLVVGLLAAVMGAASYVVYRDALGRGSSKHEMQTSGG